MIKLTANIIVILFCWVIYPYKWAKHIAFIMRKRKAIKQADERQKTSNDTVYVVQILDTFHIGIKSEMKKLDKKARKILGLKRVDNFIWDYRRSVIYKAR